jgi:hypothetical protein
MGDRHSLNPSFAEALLHEKRAGVELRVMAGPD